MEDLLGSTETKSGRFHIFSSRLRGSADEPTAALRRQPMNGMLLHFVNSSLLPECELYAKPQGHVRLDENERIPIFLDRYRG
jgi:hypothetical protein